jgi:hypothetical protein
MLLFRAEEHVDGWLAAQRVPRGYAMPLSTLWQVARIWYDGRLDPAPLTRTIDDKQAILDAAGLTGEFWRLPR